MHNIRLNNRQFTGPSKWEDLTAETLLQLAFCTCSVSVNTAGYLVMTLFKIPIKLFTKLKRCQIIQLEPLIRWTFARNTLNNWLIRSVKVGDQRLYGPKNKLADLTIEEFTYCEAAYERWLDNEKPEYLDTLFAVLYRKKAFFCTKRVAFDADRLERSEKLGKSVKHYIKRAVAINYAGCRNFIIDKHPDIWIQPHPDEEKQPGPPPTNWTQMVLNLSGDKFGTYQQSTKVNLWLVLADFNKKAKDLAELETPKS